MNTLNLKTPTIRVPGLLSDDALQEQLKIYKDNFNGGATAPPTGAVEMADRVQSEFFDAPVRNTLAMASAVAPTPLSVPLRLASSVAPDAITASQPDAQQRAIDLRSDILTDTPGMRTATSLALGGYAVREGGMLDELATLSPEEAKAEQEKRAAYAVEREAAVKDQVSVRDQLRNLTDDQATAMGLPIQPGMDAQAEKEGQLDVQRIQRAEQENVKAANAPAPTKAWWLDAIRNVPKGFVGFGTSAGRGAAIGLWELPGEILGLRDEGRSDVRAWFDTVDATMNKLLPADEVRKEDFINQLASGGGSFAGFLAGGFLAKAIGLPAKAATMILGATSGADQQYQDAEKFDAGTVQRFIAFMAGAGLGASEAIPINNMLMRAETATGGLVTRMLKNTASSSLEEFIQELGQNVGQDVVAQWLYDEQRSIDWSGSFKAAAVGGILGAAGGAAATTLETAGVIQRRPDEKANEDPTTPDVKAKAHAEFLTRFMTNNQAAFDLLTADPATATTTPAAAEATATVPMGEQLAADVALVPVVEDLDAQGKKIAVPKPASDMADTSWLDEPLTAGDAETWWQENKDVVEPTTEVTTPTGVAVPLEPVPLPVAEAFKPDRARDVTSTPEFQNWFGDSQVKTADGPVVVYHGTARGGFGQFDTAASNYGLMGQGGYFTEDPAVASEYTDKGVAKIKRQGGEPAPSVYPVFLSVKNAVDMEAPADVGAWLNAYPNYLGGEEDYGGPPANYDGFTNEQMYRAVEDAISNEGDVPTYEGAEIMQEGLRSMGFDGITHVGGGRVDPNGVKHRVWISFEPEQIKSVFNSGRFDSSNPELLASTSKTRGSYTGEQARSTAGISGQPNAAVDDVSLKQIADNFSKLLGLTVRHGRFTLKGADVMGQFSTKTGVIRLKTPNDLSTLVHEGGHALMMSADGALKKFIDDNKASMRIAARRLYGGDTSKMSERELQAEGFAEFFRVYTLSRAYSQANFAQITEEFTKVLDTDPQLRDGLQIIGDQYAAWLQMPSSQLLRNMVVSGVQTTGINAKLEEMRQQGLVSWMKEWVNGAMSATINRNNNLNRLVGDILNIAQTDSGQALDLKRAEDPRVLIRMATNAGNRAMVQLTDGVMPHRSTEPTTSSLRDVLLTYHGKPVGENLSTIDAERQKDFAAYLIALRGVDEYARWAQGKIERPPLAATMGDLQVAITEMEGKYGQPFKDAALMAHEYAMGLWEKGHQAGLIDEDTYEDGKTRGFYVPLQRDMDKDVSQSGISAAATGQGKSIVKRFKGSDRDIIDPIDALMQKTFALERVIAENEVKVALARLADKAGQVGALVERVPAHKLLGQQYSIQEIARQLTKDPTVSPTDAQDLMTILEEAIDEGNRVALFRSQQSMAAGENIVFFWEKGKLAAIQIKDGDVGADIINTLNAVGTETVPILVDLIAAPSTAFRAAVTSWPDFLLVNFIRDQMSAFVLTEGYTPFVTGLRGVGDELRQNDWARQYNAAMGTMGGMNTSTLHQARVKRDIDALRSKGYVARVFSEKGVVGKVKGFARLTELTETGTRLGIYKQTFDRAKGDGLTDWEASVEAGYVSTDYIDFGLHGNRMLAWRRLVPFLNAQLQGLYKMMRTLGADEVRQRKGLRFALTAFFKDINGLELSRTERAAIRTGRKAWLKMASLGLIGAALQAAFADDPDYQDASEYLRTTGWIIPIGNGEIFYIPKPFELAMVSNIVERGMEMASGDGEAKWRMMRGMAMNLVPPTNPPAIQAIVEQSANYNFFGGTEIVPDYMRALEPELQYNHYTSEFAKTMGKTLGWSPMRIDHIMSAFGASAYRDLTQMYNMTDPSRPASDRTDWPITRRFVRDARRGAASAQDFWKFASTVDGSLRRAELTYKNYIESGRDSAAENYLNELPADEQAYAVLNTHFKADYKRLNPTYRARQMTTIVSALRRELFSNLGVENTGPGGTEDPYMLSAKEKHDVDELLSEYARREVRNSLIYMKAPGWTGKKPLPTETTIDVMRATQPMVAEEFERRIKKAKIYDAQTIQEYWPEVRDRLISDRDGAFLKDILAVAKVMR